jgi:hypothetical protein
LRPGDLQFSVRNLMLIARVHEGVFLTLHDRVRGVGGAVFAVDGGTPIGWPVSLLAQALEKMQRRLNRLGAFRSNLDVQCIAMREELLESAARALTERALPLGRQGVCPDGRPLDVEFEIRSGRLRTLPLPRVRWAGWAPSP